MNNLVLTDRELFLLAICTVFYITLFIVTLQDKRRKIQLLQSRLDNIHAMQKMAVMERRTSNAQVPTSSPEYIELKKCVAEGRPLPEESWAALTKIVDDTYSGFTEKLFSLYRMSQQDYRVSLLIKLRLQPKDIATLTAHSKESISSTRSRLYFKVFGKKGSTKDWDDFILSI